MTVANTLEKGSRLPFPLSMDWRLIKQDKRGLANLLRLEIVYSSKPLLKRLDGKYAYCDLKIVRRDKTVHWQPNDVIRGI